jgi:hypothetical protein
LKLKLQFFVQHNFVLARHTIQKLLEEFS